MIEPVKPILKEAQPARLVTSTSFLSGRAFRFSTIKEYAVHAWITTEASKNKREPHKMNQGKVWSEWAYALIWA